MPPGVELYTGICRDIGSMMGPHAQAARRGMRAVSRQQEVDKDADVSQGRLAARHGSR